MEVMSGGKNLPGNLVERLTGHFDKRLAVGGSKHRSLCGGRDITLDVYIAVICDDRSRAGTTPAQLRHCAIFSYDFLNFHRFFSFLIFLLVNQNYGNCVIGLTGGGCV